MIFANNKSGKRTHIDEAKRGEDYYCPICEEKLICKFGKIRSHHFSHRGDTSCRDSWHYDMSDWHALWQSFFPKEYQEIVLDDGKCRHRADIMINNIVIEFQHSYISPEEFKERNDFYHSKGKIVIWVFDAANKIKEAEVDSIESGILDSYQTRSGIFTDETIRHSADLIFLCDDEREDDVEEMFYLYQVSWFWAANNLRRSALIFGTDMNYDEQGFINIVTGKEKVEQSPRVGTIPYLWHKNKIKKEAIYKGENGFNVKIKGDPIRMYEKYGRLYGFFTPPNKMYFSKQSKEVAGMNDWELISYF